MDKMKTSVVKQISFPSLGGIRGGFILLFALLLVTGCTQKSTQYPSVVEIINKGDIRLHLSDIVKFCKESKLDTSSVYEWNKHWVLYSYFTDINRIKTEIEKRFPTVTVKTYERPFYVFDRKKWTKDDIIKDWDNVIMTANLVKDTAMQKQYMEYHRTQFEKWPEVSKGFCNASFQQLLVFRNGRQLMLVISIPKGCKLDDLNPKTTENNPRVDQWNALMSKYQEGIEDAPVGTSWVMFENRK
ncbi:MAG: hypothetical protein H6Q17_1233 [Bacteroidetes bacterium]|jgi:hypothetical protein|nr:hypothetical protein [Bacteroidota bacterium]